MKPTKKPKRTKKAALLGLGLDAEDGQTRITKGENFLLYGGSEDTHAIMQETAIKVNERLDRKGVKLEDCSPRDLVVIFREIFE